MKELSIEEKAKRYDEAIEIARKINSGEGVVAPKDWAIPEVIFHELRESEGERIRKAILEHIQLCTESIPDRDKFIAWLEKQAKYKSPEEILKIRQELYQSGYNDGYKHGCEDTKKQGIKPQGK